MYSLVASKGVAEGRAGWKFGTCSGGKSVATSGVTIWNTLLRTAQIFEVICAEVAQAGLGRKIIGD